MAGVNLIFYFECKSYRLSFSSVFRSVLKVTETETCVWVNRRCLYIALERFAERQLEGLFFSFFSHGDSAAWAQVTWYLGLVRCLPCSCTCPDHLCDQEGGKGEEEKEKSWGVLGGFFSASKLRVFFDMNPKIQTFL